MSKHPTWGSSLKTTITLERVLQVIEEEPEIPGEPTRTTKEEINYAFEKNDAEPIVELLRLAVRCTKNSLLQKFIREGLTKVGETR